MTDKHEELAALIPKKEPTATERRKIISVDRETYDRVSAIADDMGMPRTKVITALVDFYETTE